MVRDGLSERLHRVEDRVAETCAKSGRDPAEIRIVAVTKGHPRSVVEEALAAGLREIGENRVAEAAEKFAAAATALDRHGATRHMVGHLQRNKVRDAVTIFDWVQSVDSVRLAEALSRRMQESPARLPILIEVNAGGEDQKHGFPLEEALDRAGEIGELPGLSLRGMMTMAPLTRDESVLRGTFRRARELFERLVGHGGGHGSAPDTLSMGMSGDYTLAIEEGSTMVRLGTVLFGARPGA
jgi:pyridoxal phosphate enzyme (YggS family)